MKDYIYDGTFEGLLTCIYHNYYTDRAAEICTADFYQPNMLHGYMEIETEPDKAARVYDAINEKISSYSLRCVYRAFLSGIRGKEKAILDYVVLGFHVGPSVGSLHGNPVVNRLEKITKKVGVERERMLQFVRFEAMDASSRIMYAQIEPDHDVLELIGHHFADRFRSDPFIIHDAGRSKAIIASGGHWYIAPFKGRQLPDGSMLRPAAEEEFYCRLWQTYFDHIAIKERTNPRCQRNFMPVRYWKHLTEMCR